MPEGNQQQQQGQQGQQGQPSTSPDWRNLESSRDKYRESAEQWRNVALKRTVESQGFDTSKGVGKLLLDAFVQEHPDLTPDQVDDTFTQYVEQVGIEPPSQGDQGQGQGQQNEPSAAEQLMEQAQQQGSDLQDLSQPPPSGNKSTQQQIAEAQQAGDLDKAQQLSMQLATEQFIQSAQAPQAPQQPAG